MNAYSDMLALPRPVSRRHPQMRRADRAKQFMPFAALKGFDEALAAAARAHAAMKPPPSPPRQPQ